MKTLFLVLLGIGVGWFLHDAAVTAIERIYDWRTPAKWAAFGLLDIVALWILWP